MVKKIGSKEDLILAKLIKQYIIFNPGCTAKDISLFFLDHEFGLMGDYTKNDISKIIAHYMNPKSNTSYKWFSNVRVTKKNRINTYTVDGE